MKVPDKIFKQWQDMRSHGDAKKIAEQKGITEMDVSRAFANQECSDEVFKSIADFFKDKQEKLVKEYLPDENEPVNK